MTLMTSKEVTNLIEKTVRSSNPREIPLKGLYFGRLWYNINEFSNAVEWIVKYLRKYDRDASAHRLLGDCYEKLSEHEAALLSYKQSLLIKPNQHDLMLHLVELFLNPGPSQNPTKAQVWLDKAAIALPGDPVVFKMKMELLLAQQASPKTLEDAILKELRKQPNDPSLHVQYVTFMRTQDRLSDAYLYCNKICNLLHNSVVNNDYKWSSCVVHTYKEYVNSPTVQVGSLDYIVAHCLLLEALSRFIWLCIVEKKQTKALEKLSLMDQYLLPVALVDAANEWNVVVEEMKGQLSWLVATLLLYEAEQRNLSWMEASRLAAFFYAYSFTKPIPTTSSSWAVHCSGTLTQLPVRLHKNAGVRMSQCCHMMCLIANKAGDSWSMMVQQVESSQVIGKVAHRCLFGDSRDGRLSFLFNAQLVTRNMIIPSASDMLQYDEIAAMTRDLQMLIWVGMRWMEMEETSDFFPWSSKAFPVLKVQTEATTSTSVLSLSLLDVESFLAASIFTALKMSEVWSNVNVTDKQSLSCVSMPTALCRRLTTDLQDKWWTSASKLTISSSELSVAEAAKLKPILQRGLECLHGIGNHGLETRLIAKLAKYFAAKALSLSEEGGTTSAWYIYQRRAVMYWFLAIPELTRVSEGRSVHRTVSKDHLFSYVYKEPTSEEAKSMLSEAYMCIGELAAQENRTDDALSFYGKAELPQASFCQAHLYKTLADSIPGSNTIGLPLFESSKRKELYMKKYRHCLEVTISRLQQQPDESLHERTIRLLQSPHVSPARISANKSAGESILQSPNKQSTPKNNNLSEEGVLSASVEKESVTNLVDTISTLTSALSSLQMEMGYLREENRLMREFSSPHGYHSTPQPGLPPRFAGKPGFSSKILTPGMYHSPDLQNQMQAITPQRQYLPQNMPVFPLSNKDGIAARQSPAQVPYADVYAQDAFYNAGAASQYVPNHLYQEYPDNTGLIPNVYGMPGYSNMTQQGYASSHPPDAGPTYSDNQPVNLLAASLQDPSNKVALQKKLGAALLGASSASTPGYFTSAQNEQQLSNNMYSSLASRDVPTATGKSPQPVTTSNTSLIQQLLQQDDTVSITTTPVVKKEIRQNPKPNVLSVATPITKQSEVHFLDKFVTSKSPGATMKFQSPEQMDRENKELSALEEADQDTSHNNDTGPHFEPIIKLPDLIQVKTGEEDEEIIFSERCKLYRWSADQWKERGVGDMKLLRHKQNGKSRLVMRRDQILKVCCNHYITESMLLSPMPSSDRAMVWHAYDFSDDKPKDEKFAAKFRTYEIAQQFRDAVNDEASRISETEHPVTSYQATTVSPAQIRTHPSHPALETGAAKFTLSPQQSPSSMPHNSVSFAQKDSEEKPTPSIFSNIAGVLSSAGFAGSGPNGGIKLPLTPHSFGPPTPKPKDTSAYHTSSSLQPSRQQLVDKPGSEQHDEDDDAGPHHQPIIDLPKLVEVKTGEEEEEVVFCHRAKLFRYVPPEWKERGLGDMKILKHKSTGKYRVVMRREQVLKLCANHHITTGMRMSPQGSSAKAWVWSAMDFADSSIEPQQETFAVKFKTVEEAQEFYQVFAEGLKADDKEVPSISMPPPSSPSEAAGAFLRKEMSMQAAKEKPKTDPTKASVPLGFNLPPKTSGSWNCPDCYASNTAEHEICPCCECPNPNIEPTQKTAPKPSSNQPFKASFGSGMPATSGFTSGFTFSSANFGSSSSKSNIVFGSGSTTSTPAQKSSEPSSNQPFKASFGSGMPATSGFTSGFTFGSPKSATNGEHENSTKQHPALQRAGVHLPFKFGSGISNITNSSNKPVFETSSPAFGIFDSSNQSGASGEGHSKPRFPSVGDENDADGDTTTSDESSDDDYYGEFDQNDEENEKVCATHRSPMNRLSSRKEEGVEQSDADDVIYVGEVLPSKELQEKAKKLQLPPHFYNYLSKEETSDADSTDSKSLPTVPSEPYTTAPTANIASGFAFSSSSNVSFAQLAASGSSTGFSFNANLEKPDDPAWKPDTKPMFSHLSESANDEQDTSADDIHVNPIVELPKSVTVETGEEDETTLYSRRAKLYRWDKETGQWKERGIGDIMIKHNPSRKCFRVLMRREQVLKVCANHYITSEMKMEETFGSDRAWSWVAVDFSDNQEEPKMEMFAVRFKTPEFAVEFKDRFDECQLLLRVDDEKETCPNPSGSSAGSSASTLINKAEKMKSELGFFKDQMSVKSNIDLENTFTEDLKGSSVSKFDPNLPLTPLVKQHQLDKEKHQKDSRIPRPVREKSNTSDRVPQTDTDKEAPAKATLGSDKFEFKLKTESTATPSNHTRSPRRNTSVCSVTSEDSQADHIHFEPIIPLPEKVTVPTGEEDSQILFDERAKLYVFDRDNQQWKERGLGNIHLLQDTNTFKLRLVMRREQVLKVCLNHYVSSDVTFSYKENSANKVLVWTTNDFSDNEKINGETLQFALRFKTSDISAQFMACLDEGRTACDEKRILDTALVYSNLSVSAHEDAGEDKQEAEEASAPGSSPVKPAKPLFSFANVESPFSKTDSHFGDFTFDATPQTNASTSTNFVFDKNILSFNFGCTSTPSVSVVSEKPSLLPTSNTSIKTDVSKSLFGVNQLPSSSTTESEVKPISAFQSPFSFQPKSDSTFHFDSAAQSNAQFQFPLKESAIENQSEHEETETSSSSDSGESDTTESGADNLDAESDHEDDDVIFVWEATPTEEQRIRAEKLQLPSTFFLYENNDKEHDFNSDEEEEILQYIYRRDNSQTYCGEEYDKNAGDNSTSNEADDNATPNNAGDIGAAVAEETEKPEEKGERPKTGNLFEAFSEMSGFSFASMAAETSSKHAFGLRKDAAFNVSAASRVLFQGQGDNESGDPEAYNPEYKPVLDELPPVVEVKTGEENEEVLFKERCKLYRFDEATSQWKERGLGELKILHHPELNWYRVVMRREQVLKVCANHLIKKDTKLLRNSDKAWMYIAHDKSESDHPTVEKFTARFKTPEIAEKFHDVWLQAQQDMEGL